ncbi:DNA-dependent RNA polymerase subunit epsilon [Sporosarcina trichiuri]|uniref:DNA-dependent RNA polymerase subunit epsilon n=1 Tax=Sporosarcina trichiuri TaxID=3056445 RepID=UPI0025B4970D|nr:DNA-directed RNA polymerase subunit epsilon [Sporosarcina sp. 0.2-SM1T-5]WJY28869.1 DNA-directed RNA polymerase subunit epsilon [Sporosarcina sp. 0.2-SM1T-5]
MIFKVYYQDSKTQVPVRENTKTLYVEAETQREVRQKLQDRNYNIEFIQQLEGEHLEYEQASAHFELEQV